MNQHNDEGKTAEPMEPRWPALWVRAALRTAILRTLEEGPLHGYGIAQALQRLGFGRPKGGSLYPILEEFLRAGQVEAQWTQGDAGPGRKEYSLTQSGRLRLERERQDWDELTAVLRAGSTGCAGSARRDDAALTTNGHDTDMQSQALTEAASLGGGAR